VKPSSDVSLEELKSLTLQTEGILARRKGNNLGELADLMESFSHLRVVALGPSKSGKSELVKALSKDKDIVTNCDGEATTRSSNGYTVNASSGIEWIDTPGIEDYEEKKINTWWSKNMDTFRPQIAFLMMARNIRCSKTVYIYLLKKLLQKKIFTILVISDINRLNEEEFQTKTKERDFVAEQALKMCSTLTIPSPLRNDNITTYYEKMLYGLEVNSCPFVLKRRNQPVEFPIEGIDTLVSLIKQHFCSARMLAEQFLCYAEDVRTPDRLKNWFRELWVEFSRDSKKEMWAKSTFGEKGGEFFYYALKRVERYETTLQNEYPLVPLVQNVTSH